MEQSPPDIFRERYEVIEIIGSGTFSNVISCRNKENGKMFAVKQLKRYYRNWEAVDKLTEVRTLMDTPEHPNILKMVELHFDPAFGRVSIVLELMDTDLFQLIKHREGVFRHPCIQSMMRQILKGLNHLHTHMLFHRDLKPENILVKFGNGEYLLALGDFGSVESTRSSPPYTEYMSTRWFRAPECMLTKGYYGPKVDIWAAGCIFYEILTLAPLFDGLSVTDQLEKIHELIGPPPMYLLRKFYKVKSSNFQWFPTPPSFTPKMNVLLADTNFFTRDFLRRMTQYDPDYRDSAAEMLKHKYLQPAPLSSDSKDTSAVRKALDEANAVATRLLAEEGRRIPSSYQFQNPDQGSTSNRNRSVPNSTRNDDQNSSQTGEKPKFRNMSLRDNDSSSGLLSLQAKSSSELHADLRLIRQSLVTSTESNHVSTAETFGCSVHPHKKRVTFKEDCIDMSGSQGFEPHNFRTALNRNQYSLEEIAPTEEPFEESEYHLRQNQNEVKDPVIESPPTDRKSVISAQPQNDLKPATKTKTMEQAQKKKVRFEGKVRSPTTGNRDYNEPTHASVPDPPKGKSIDEFLLTLKNKLTDLNFRNNDFLKTNQLYIPQQLPNNSSSSSFASFENTPRISHEMLPAKPPHMYESRLLKSKFDGAMNRFEGKYGGGTMSFRAKKPFELLFKNPEVDPPSDYPSLIKVELEEQRNASKVRQIQQPQISENSDQKDRQAAGSNNTPKATIMKEKSLSEAITVTSPDKKITKAAIKKLDTKKPKPDANNNNPPLPEKVDIVLGSKTIRQELTQMTAARPTTAPSKPKTTANKNHDSKQRPRSLTKSPTPRTGSSNPTPKREMTSNSKKSRPRVVHHIMSKANLVPSKKPQ